MRLLPTFSFSNIQRQCLKNCHTVRSAIIATAGLLAHIKTLYTIMNKLVVDSEEVDTVFTRVSIVFNLP